MFDDQAMFMLGCSIQQLNNIYASAQFSYIQRKLQCSCYAIGCVDGFSSGHIQYTQLNLILLQIGKIQPYHFAACGVRIHLSIATCAQF